jgi:hypothetical protein
MSENSQDAKVFPVDTRFQQLARRPGGIPRAEAIERAQTQVDEIKVTFDDWFDERLRELTGALPADGPLPKEGPWIEAVHFHCRQLRDVGTTMGYELVTFIAGNFCELLEAIRNGAEPNRELIDLHVEALRMSRQRRYQRTTPADYPELSSGLHKLLSLAKAGSDPQPDN